VGDGRELDWQDKGKRRKKRTTRPGLADGKSFCRGSFRGGEKDVTKCGSKRGEERVRGKRGYDP